jgi:xanthine dehydrogenase YagR molybdenum-binding subunit
MSIIGAPINRTDGWAKVSGGARYAAEHPVRAGARGAGHQHHPERPRLRIDDSAARAVPGVLLVMTHENAMRLPPETKSGKIQPPTGTC